ncbi:carboxypeptidase s1 like protein [Zymoseptoria brevis]|uniref:Carboxypeptidase s1 like protein n=1 Tax=Zymoseptoria brevis TaxID=1047168 RepID=A0A0F4GUV5_9PEZI|nr:carboxypeptidase s1 like protein [Zymoseptoria brevis]
MGLFLRASALLTVLLAIPSSLAQILPPPTDLINGTGYFGLPVRWKEVPAGTCELTEGVKSYSGYVDIAENQHIFFWFFESRTVDPQEADLTVWINGGPGSSSMIGLFQELGPCTLDGDLNPVNNPYAWNNASNVLFIDHPSQVGFSYSTPFFGYLDQDTGGLVPLPNNTCPESQTGNCGTFSDPDLSAIPNSTVAAAPSMWKTLQGFMGVFPQYSRSDFNFATESYGGHYAPIFNEYIQAQNALIDNGELSGAHHINLRTVLIGNGWYDPLIAYAAYYNFTVFPGNTYDIVPYNSTIQDQVYDAMYGPGNCYDQTLACKTSGNDTVCRNADNFCFGYVENVLDQVANRDEYDIRFLMEDPFPNTGDFSQYLNSDKVLRAIGAHTNWLESSNAVGSAFGNTGDDDREVGTVEAIRQLVEQGVYVVMYAGDADYTCNWLGNEAIADQVNATGYCEAGYTNITTSDGIVHGQVKQSGNFAWARIYYSGHEVPYYQPLLALEMFNRAISQKDIATGESDLAGYITVGTAKSTFRQGNATVSFEVLPSNTTYNFTTNAANPPPPSGNGKRDVGKKGEVRKVFKPVRLG